MAIRPSSALSNGVYYEQQSITAANYYARGNGVPAYAPNPPPFNPTGKGLSVTNSNTVANASNANAVMINRGASPKDPYYSIYLFVDTVSSAWSISGSTSQASGSRSFYPRNLVQDTYTIAGTMPNQNEFDKLVRFVERAQYIAMNGAKYSSTWYNYIDFLLYRPKSQNTFNHIAHNQNLGIEILNVAAGHERFQFAPAYSLSCKVLDDRTDSNRNNLYTDLVTKIGATQIYGNFTTAKAFVAGTATDPPNTKTVTTTQNGLTTKETITGP